MSAPHQGSPAGARPQAPSGAAGAWRDPGFLALVGVAALLGTWSWIRVEGALFADVVEYLERARALVAGEELLDAQKVRAAGITALHAPALWLAGLAGVAEGPWVLLYAGFVHLLISASLLFATRQLTIAIAGAIGVRNERLPAAGNLAAAAALASPTLVQFMAIPMTDVAAGAALALGMERALFDPAGAAQEAGGGRRAGGRGRAAGAWLGVAVMCAYKAIPLVLMVLVAMVVGRTLSSGPRAAARTASGAMTSLATLVLAQCVLDRVTYGQFGVGLWTYLLINFGPQSGQLLYEIGAVDLGQWLYQQGANAIGEVTLDDVSRSTDDFRALAGRTWYLDHFQWFSARWLAPAVGLGAAAVALRSVRGGSRAALVGLMPLGIALAYGALTSFKGSKDMRIWLPVLPAYAAYMGIGLVVLAGSASAAAPRLRAAVVAILLLGGVLQAAAPRLPDPHRTLWGLRARGAVAGAGAHLGRWARPEGRVQLPLGGALSDAGQLGAGEAPVPARRRQGTTGPRGHGEQPRPDAGPGRPPDSLLPPARPVGFGGRRGARPGVPRGRGLLGSHR